MAGKRADLLLQCMLGNRWRATSGVSLGASTSASSPIAGANSRVHLESLVYSIKNQSGASVHTVQVQVRGSNGNTVLWSAEHLVASTATANVNISNMAFPTPKLGTGLIVAMNTAVTSCSYAVNAAGWIEDTNG